MVSPGSEQSRFENLSSLNSVTGHTESPSVERRLAAVFAADIVGYSRLMEVDEEGTLARLKSVRVELIDPAIAKCRGRMIKTTGDGMLVEFQSVTEALRCATEFQERMARRNRDLPASRALLYRIGINLGDVIAEEHDIFGDGVNVAARLEGMAEPGGICVSAAVRDQVGDRLAVEFVDLGEQQVKNIARPIRAYKVVLPGGSPEEGGHAAPGRAAPKAASKAEDRRPSIAVLPFVNMSGDPQQEFFADGLTEDIITELSRFRQLLVISRNAVFVHKGKPVKAKQVAREFGVDYIVEGSVRKAGDRVRVTVQLIDGETETHLWAERYDRKLEDIFEIQDEVTSSVAATLFGRVEAARHDRVQRRTTDNMAAYEHVLAGKILHHRSNREANAEALRHLNRAIELDPNYAHAHAWKACVMGQAWGYDWCEDKTAQMKVIGEELRTALGLDDNDADVHRILAAASLAFNEHDKAAYHQERALSLNPNSDLIVVQQGELLSWLGRPEEGIEWIRRAMRLNPYHPERFWSHLGRAQYAARLYTEALASFSKLTAPDYPHHAFLAAAAAQLGDRTASTAHAHEVMQREPGFSADSFIKTLHFRQASDNEHLREGLLKAGLPSRFTADACDACATSRRSARHPVSPDQHINKARREDAEASGVERPIVRVCEQHSFGVHAKKAGDKSRRQQHRRHQGQSEEVAVGGGHELRRHLFLQ
jgi:adenylate cyclase